MFPPARQRCAASCSWNAALNVTTNESYKSVLRQRTHARAHTLTARYLRMVPVSPASPVELARAARLDGRWSALCGMVACGSGEGAADSLMGARASAHPLSVLCTPLGTWKKQRIKVKAASADEVQQLLSELARHKCAPNALPPAAREASVAQPMTTQIHEVHRVV